MVCVGYQTFTFVVGDFDMLSALTMCPMAGMYRLAFRFLNELFLLVVS